jgi:glycyl-tRNA synthetase
MARIMATAKEPELMEKIISLCKRRGFVFPGSEIYGGLANSWDYGPLGVELKNNIKQLWWKRFVQQRDDMVGIDAALMMNPKVWEASGHVAGFTDPLVECKKCHQRYREDQLEGKCPNCGNTEFTPARQFNLLFPTHIGPVQDDSTRVYLRGEIAQAMFVDFKQVLDSSRVKIPFGIAAQGRAFRNEITPGNFIFRTREFDLMEFEYFIRSDEWEKWFEYWRKEMHGWLEQVGVDMSKVHEHDIPDGERAHYSKRTIDFEFDYPFGRKELYGLAYRTDYDLSQHEQSSGQSLKYRDPETNEEYTPHVIEPSFGLDRTVLVVLLSAYQQEEDRIVLKLQPRIAPYKAAIFPLLKNKSELVAKAREVYDGLLREFPVAWDDRGNIGKRYLAQDEIGTPWCITVDFQTLEDGTITVRDRDTKEQQRVAIGDLQNLIRESLR